LQRSGCGKLETMKAFHGTNEVITEFKTKERIERGVNGLGNVCDHYYHTTGETEFVYFASNIEVSKSYGKNIMDCELTISNPFILDAQEKHYSKFENEIQQAIWNRIDTGLNDSIIILNLRDGLGRYNSDLISDVYMVKPSQIKIN
jgi:hypothetical protein